MDRPICIDDMEKWAYDFPYHPDDVDFAYLSEGLVDDICKSIKPCSERYDEIIKFIKKHEELHRKSIMGEVDRYGAQAAVDSAAHGYRIKYWKWIHQENEYMWFYRLVNNGRWE